MTKGQMVAIIAGIVILVIIAVIVLGNSQEPMENVTDEEILIPIANSTDSVIEEKLSIIEQKAKENKELIENSDYEPDRPREWITSGPFQIDREEYYLGEKVFLRIGGLDWLDKGQAVFLRPLNSTHYSVYQTIPFDGQAKPAFNYYIEPKLNANLGICSKQDLVGEWTITFRGTDYSNLKFNYTDQAIPGDEEKYDVPVC